MYSIDKSHHIFTCNCVVYRQPCIWPDTGPAVCRAIQGSWYEKTPGGRGSSSPILYCTQECHSRIHQYYLFPKELGKYWVHACAADGVMVLITKTCISCDSGIISSVSFPWPYMHTIHPAHRTGTWLVPIELYMCNEWIVCLHIKSSGVKFHAMMLMV